MVGIHTKKAMVCRFNNRHKEAFERQRRLENIEFAERMHDAYIYYAETERGGEIHA